MSKRVTKTMVFLYVLKQLSEADRRLVEEVFPTDLQVQSWFVRLGARPDNVVEEDEEELTLTVADLRRADSEVPTDDTIPEAVDNYFAQRAKARRSGKHREASQDERTEADMALAALATFQRLPSAKRADRSLSANILKLDVERCGGVRTQWSFPEKLAGAVRPPAIAKKNAAQVSADKRPLHLWQDGEKVFVEYPESSIPFGLGWLILEEPDGLVTLFLPRFTFNPKARIWFAETTVQEILGKRRPKDARLIARFIPATTANQTAFDGGQVRAFVQALPQYEHQRACAEKLLALMEKSHGKEEKR